MKKMFNTIFAWAPQNLWDRIVVAVMAVLGYFSPVKHITLLVLGLFFLDILFGYWKSWKIDKAKFKPSIIWEKTVPRMVIVIILLLGAFMLDKETGQDYIATCKIVGWFFGALLLHSIGENGYKVTGWKALSLFGKFAQKKIEDELGVKINKEDL